MKEKRGKRGEKRGHPREKRGREKRGHPRRENLDTHVGKGKENVDTHSEREHPLFLEKEGIF